MLLENMVLENDFSYSCRICYHCTNEADKGAQQYLNALMQLMLLDKQYSSGQIVSERINTVFN